jgi:hypothetical protein
MKNVELLREIEKKFTSTDLGTYGILPSEKADEFINLTLTQSALLNAVTVYRTDNRAGEFYVFDLPGHVIKAAAEGTAWDETDTGSFTTDKAFEYSCKKLVSAFRMTWETINWALNAPDFEDFIVQNWSRRMKDDLEVLALNGDSSSTDPFLGIDDGWLKLIEDGLADTGQIIDWVDASGNPKPVDPALWQLAYKAFISNPYARAMVKNPVWITNPIVYVDYMHYLAEREDNLGAAALMGAAELRPDGVPFFNGANGVPYMPVVEDGNGNLVTKILLGDPKQLWLVIHREFRGEYTRKPELDAWDWIGWAYVDFVVPFPQTFVLVKNVKVGTAPETGGNGGS